MGRLLNMPGKNRLTALVLFLVPPLAVQACDTWVALKDASATGTVLLAKNSDRTGTESQPLVLHPRTRWLAGTSIDLGRLSIPQVERTYATLGSGPYWCWGYEEGINEFSVSIGNEGVFTRPLADLLQQEQRGKRQERGFTGMDLVRLGLERGKTAHEALKVITGLLETYGQLGSGLPGKDTEGCYDNTFLIADPHEAWILETAGRQWAARRIAAGVASISNTLSIENKWDLCSPGMEAYAAKRLWVPQKKTFSFREAYLQTSLKRAVDRRALIRASRTRELLELAAGSIDLAWMMRIARDRDTDPSIDMDVTASSCVSVLTPGENGLPVFWWNAGSPGTGCYVPFFVHGSRLPAYVSNGGSAGRQVTAPSLVLPDSFRDDSWWWLFHDLFTRICDDREARSRLVRAAFDSLESVFAAELEAVTAEAHAMRSAGDDAAMAGMLDTFTDSCVSRVIRRVNLFRQAFSSPAPPDSLKGFLGTYRLIVEGEDAREMIIRYKNGGLALDVPGQMVYELKAPDRNGRREFAVTTMAAVSFEWDSAGSVCTMLLHQSTPLSRNCLPDSVDTSLGDSSLAHLWGRYAIPGQGAYFSILPGKADLILITPDNEEILLQPPDEQGRWRPMQEEDFSISFQLNAAGESEAMHLHQLIPFRRCD